MSDRQRALESHFRFGENWRRYVDVVEEENLAAAVQGLSRLLPEDSVLGKRFLDIGCGSGMSMLAAMRLGAAHCQGIDIDPDSVQAARTLLARFCPDMNWDARVGSILDHSEDAALYDVVHSWGVLHHTGAMWEAIRRAAARVAPDGLFVLSIYRKTPTCGFWRVEKRLYTAMPRVVQKLMALPFMALYLLGILVTGRNPVAYVRNYKQERGMSWSHDIHDWLGGYPYESASEAEIEGELAGAGFVLVRKFAKPAVLAGLLGSHCDEFVFRRTRSHGTAA